MFEVFPVVRDLHELLWYLTEALTLQPARPLHGELGLALQETQRLTHNSPDGLVQLDVAAHRRDINGLLLRTSELVRAEVRHKKKDRNWVRPRAIPEPSCHRRLLAQRIGSLPAR
jgi:hypothetical protein